MRGAVLKLAGVLSASALLTGCQGSTAQQAAAPAPELLDPGFASYTFRLDTGDGDIVEGAGSFRNAPSSLTTVTIDEALAEGKNQPGLTMLETDDATFVQSPDWLKGAPVLAGKWFSVTGRTPGLDLAFLRGIGAHGGMADPYQQLQLLETGRVETIGPETIDGVRTVHKRSTATMDEVWANHDVGHRIRGVMQASGMTAEDYRAPNIFDAWIDESGRVVKFEWREQSDTSNSTFVTTASYDESRVADLAAPVPDLVIDHAEFARLERMIKKAKAGTATAADLRKIRELAAELGLDSPVVAT